MDLTIDERFVTARLMLQKDATYFYALATFMNMKENPAVGTAGVDIHGTMYWNREFVLSLTIKELAGTIAHEALHVGFIHMLRTNGRHGEIWNIAADIKVNHMLTTMGMVLPSGALIPDSNSYTFNAGMGPDGAQKTVTVTDIDKKTVEKLYDEIYEQVKDILREGSKPGAGESGPGSEKGEGQPQSGLFGKEFDKHITSTESQISPDERDKITNKWRSNNSLAAQIAKQRGKFPGQFQGVLDALLKDKVNWRTILNNYMTNYLPVDYTWQKPHKKSLAIRTYLPNIVRESIDVIVAIDTSGSISQKIMQEFLGEITSIARAFKGLTMTILFADTDIHDVYEVNGSSADINSMELTGGRGGTSHVDVAKWVRDNKSNAKVVVCLTDGYTEFPDINSISCDWIWAISEGGIDENSLPFGRYIKIED
ncbi:vWA domain-containing protein [Acinetobacter sp.]|uniref:vWA domain-containing protein n=1 Tax=Acinetobacter sp. TaxID=472 RepID=UPI003D0161E5